MTPSDILLTALVRAEVAGSFVILLVLLLRGPARRLIGAQLAYRLWAAPLVAAVAAIFPSLAEFHPGADLTAAGPSVDAPLILLAWAAGVAATAALMVFAEVRFRRQVREGRAGPSVVGVLWPRMVTPADYRQRFDPAERALIRQHECKHIERGDPAANLVTAAVQALSWFNPLVHIAGACARLDQELACDAAVIETRPEVRRLYGATLLKAHTAPSRSLLACAWPAAARHPLETRLAMLARRPLTLSLYLRGATIVAVVAAVAAFSVWSMTPAWDAPPTYVWPAAFSRNG